MTQSSTKKNGVKGFHPVPDAGQHHGPVRLVAILERTGQKSGEISPWHSSDQEGMNLWCRAVLLCRKPGLLLRPASSSLTRSASEDLGRGAASRQLAAPRPCSSLALRVGVRCLLARVIVLWAP